MKMSVRLGTVLAVAAVLFTSLSAFAQGPGGPGGMGGFGRGSNAVVADLNLTDTQREKLTDVCRVHLEKSRTLRQQLIEKRQQLIAEVLSDQPNQDRIAARRKDMDALHSKIVVLNSDDLLKVSQVLTPEQSAKLLKAVQNYRLMGPGPGGLGIPGPNWGGGRPGGGEGFPPPPPGAPGSEGPGGQGPGPRVPSGPRQPDIIAMGLMDMVNM